MTGRLMGTLILGGEEVGRERKAAAGAVNGGERVQIFYVRERRGDRGYFFMDTHGYCSYVHMARFGRSNNDEKRRKEGANARVSGELPNEKADRGTGEKKQRQG